MSGVPVHGSGTMRRERICCGPNGKLVLPDQDFVKECTVDWHLSSLPSMIEIRGLWLVVHLVMARSKEVVHP